MKKIPDQKELEKELSDYLTKKYGSRIKVISPYWVAKPEAEGFSLGACEAQLESMQAAYTDVRAVLVDAGAELRTPVAGVIELIDQVSRFIVGQRSPGADLLGGG